MFFIVCYKYCKKGEKMFHLQPQYPSFTINDLIEKNQQFLCDFINLKREGFLSYSKALNIYTYGFWSPWLKEADQSVINLAEHMKLCVKFK